MPEDKAQDALSSLRVKRNTYSFMQRKRYTPTKHFSVKKKAANPLAYIMEMLTPKPPPKKKKGGQGAPGAKDTAAVELPFNKLAIWAAAAFALILLAIAFFAILIAGSSGLGQPPPQSTVFNATFGAQIYKAGFLTYGPQGDGRSQAYFVLDFLSNGAKNATINSKLYSNPPSNQVFFLQYQRDGADTYFEFRKKFDAELSEKGWQVTDARIEDLKTLEGGSTLVIPTGYLPEKLLGSQDGSFPSISDLASRGISVIYMGQPFDQQVMKPNGDLIKADSQLYAKTAIEFARDAHLQSTEGFRLQSPFYSAYNKNSKAATLWGSISVVRRNSGYILFLPESLDGGWVGDGAAAADDVVRLITTEPYRPSFASLNYTQSSISDSRIYRNTFFFEPTKDGVGYLRSTFTIFDYNNNSRQFFIDWASYPEAAGKLYLDSPALTPQYLGGGRKTVIIDLKEPQPGEEKLYFELSKNASAAAQIPVEQGKTNTQITRSAPVQFSQNPGEYILRVVDNSGKIYAATRVEMAGLDIKFEDSNSRPSYSFKEGVFNATFYSAGRQIAVPYVSVSLEGQPKAAVRQYSNAGSISYSPAIELKKGNYTFVFDFGSGYTQKKTLEYFLATNVWERPEVIVLAIVAALVFGAGFYLRRPEKEKFSLDVPDFPPQSSTKIPLSQEKILSVFEQVNKDFHWQMMPLSLEELKGGLRKVLIEGRPVIIGDYNLERLLQKLEGRGLTGTYSGFWALKSWESSSGFSIRLMCTYRFMRDVFVNNAIKFSKLRAINGCDVKALIGRSEYYFQIYLGEGDEATISRALQSANISHTWILFEDQEELERFKNKLSSSSSYLVLKMNVGSKRVRLFTLDEFSKIIKTLRSRYSS
ncbi:MAG: hypothetical protein V1822_03465 [Candidatus Micrarchaeota archaeon]